MPQIMPTIDIISSTAPMSIRILAQFRPVNRATPKINDTIPRTAIASPKPPKSAKLNPDTIVITEPIICKIASIVTPVGRDMAEGATELNVVSPHFWQ